MKIPFFWWWCPPIFWIALLGEWQKELRRARAQDAVISKDGTPEHRVIHVRFGGRG